MNKVKINEIENKKLILKALKQAIANVMLESDSKLDMNLTEENIEKVYKKIFEINRRK